MHLELVELLRCPVSHASSVLVAAADVVSNRYITQGLLGCPECQAEYPIHRGVTHFDAVAARAVPERAPIAEPIENVVDPLALAAQIGLVAGRAVFALVGYDIDTVAAARDLVAARVLVLNPSQFDAMAFPTESLQDAALVAPIGVLRCSDVLPLVPAKFDGIAFRSSYASPQLLDQAVSALRSGGRLVASVQLPIPAGMRELVRDERVWVAERESVASAPISLRRR